MIKKYWCKRCNHRYMPIAFRRYGDKCPICGSTEHGEVHVKYVEGGEIIVTPG